MSPPEEGCTGSDKSTLHLQIRKVSCLENNTPGTGPQKTKLLAHYTVPVLCFAIRPQDLNRGKRRDTWIACLLCWQLWGKADGKFLGGLGFDFSPSSAGDRKKSPHCTLAKNVTRTERHFQAKTKMSGLMRAGTHSAAHSVLSLCPSEREVREWREEALFPCSWDSGI